MRQGSTHPNPLPRTRQFIGIEPTTRTCLNCEIAKPSDDFTILRTHTNKTYRRRVCRDCFNLATRKRRTTVLLVTRQRYRRMRQLAKYGLTPEYYQKQVELQDGKCLICKKPTDKLYVDHNHVTGKFRGLICLKCNTVIGMADDEPTILEAAVEYLNAAR